VRSRAPHNAAQLVKGWKPASALAKQTREVGHCVRRLARKLPAFREAVDADLCTSGLDRRRVLAVALRMLDYGVFRTGNTEYAEEYGSRGAATLLREDVRVSKGRVVFDFVAKGGQQRTLELDDDHLVVAVRSLKRGRHKNPRLLVYRDAAGYHEIDAGMVNERFHELVGDDYTVKDLRTWTATVHAAVDLGGGSAYYEEGVERGGQGDARGSVRASGEHADCRARLLYRSSRRHAVQRRSHRCRRP